MTEIDEIESEIAKLRSKQETIAGRVRQWCEICEVRPPSQVIDLDGKSLSSSEAIFDWCIQVGAPTDWILAGLASDLIRPYGNLLKSSVEIMSHIDPLPVEEKEKVWGIFSLINSGDLEFSEAMQEINKILNREI